MSARETILRRRARFCAVALAGAGLAGCGDESQAQPCLLTSLEDTEVAPEACLMVLPDSELLDSGPVDALPETREDASDGGDADAFDAPRDATGDVPGDVTPADG